MVKKYYLDKIFIVLLFLTIINKNVALARNGEYSYNEENLKNYSAMLPKPTLDVSPLSSNLVGESLDLNSGMVQFKRIDANIPGNSSLEVAYRLNYQVYQPDMLEWQQETPRIEYSMYSSALSELDALPIAKAWQVNQTNYCSADQTLGSLRYKYYSDIYSDYKYKSVSGSKYSSGLRLIIPGNFDSRLLYNGKLTSSEYKYATKEGWRLKCYQKGGSEGFLAVSPEGVKYYLDFYNKPRITNSQNDSIKLIRSSYYKHTFRLQVSKVEDRFGNYVLYRYFDDGKLKNIKSNDGRLIEFNYPNYYDTIMTAGDKTWSYIKNSDTGEYTITEPGNRIWKYDIYQVKGRVISQYDDESCPPVETPKDRMIVYHPDGAKVTFDFSQYEIYKTNVIPRYLKSRYDYESLPNSSCSNYYSLDKKQIVHSDGESYSWSYDYSATLGTQTNTSDLNIGVHHYLDGVIPSNIDKLHYSRTIVTNPDNSKIKYYFNRDSSSFLQGSLAAEEHFNKYNIKLKSIKSFFEEGNQYGSLVVSNHYNRYVDRYIASVKKTEENLNGNLYTKEFSSLNLYNRYEKIIESNDISLAKKYLRFSYEHDLVNWNLNLPSKIEISDDNTSWDELYKYTYFSGGYNGGYKSQLRNVYKSGMLLKTNQEYHADGNLRKVVYSNKKYFTEYHNYFRGKAKIVKKPKRLDSLNTMQSSLKMNYFGQITTSVDFKGVSTHYDYDDAGRLKLIDIVNDAQFGNWYDSLITWNDSTQTRTISKCILNTSRTGCVSNSAFKTTVFKTTEYYDNLLRLILVKNQDLTNRSIINGIRYQRFEYDYFNRPIFTSYVSTNQDEDKGTYISYDALGRKSKETLTGLGLREYDYLSGNRLQVTDAENNTTITTYQAYGSPSYNTATKIESPENVTTEIDVDVLGRVNAISQTGTKKDGGIATITETRHYNSANQLCLVTRPDVGNTIYGLNVLGEIVWSKTGVSNTSCTTTKPANAVSYTYDNLGDTYKVIYPDNSGNVTYERDNNGNILTLTAGNVVHRYNYNNQNLLEDEMLLVGSQKPLMLDYSYNGMQQLSHLTYPDGTTVHFKPNSYGEPTEVQSYNGTLVDLSFAKEVTYYPNGVINSFIYGNGVTHKTTLHQDSLLPKQIKDTAPIGSIIPSNVMSLTYDYDNNANITSIIDGQNSAYSLTNLTYDGLDRLESITGGTGIGSSNISYDGLGNITSYQSKGRTLNYAYDYTKNRLTKVTGVSGRYGSIGYDSRGNITNNGAYSLAFNAANQLTTAKGNSYLYDGHNRRVKQTDASGTSYSMYSQDGTLLYREKGNSITGNGINYLYLGKKLIAKYGEMSPQSIEQSRQHYRPFGETIEVPKDDVGYTGHKFDTDLGLSYMQARYYDPVIGRFYSNDPIGFRDVHSFNRYAYANNNPYKYTDPDGNNPVAIGRFVAPPPIIQSTPSGVGQSTQPTYITSGGRNTERTDRFGNLVFNESADPVEGILDGATEGEKTKGRTKNFDKLGGMDQANSDFDDAVDPDSVETITDGKGGEGRRGTVNDGSGRKINVRPNSTDGRPTVEVQDGKNKTKIRYDEENS